MPSGHTVRPNPWAGVVVGGHNYWYLGDLDEPAIYPRALTPAEVLEHYQAGTAATPPVTYRDVVLGDNPVGYWPFDEPGSRRDTPSGSASHRLHLPSLTLPPCSSQPVLRRWLARAMNHGDPPAGPYLRFHLGEKRESVAWKGVADGHG